MQEWRQTIQESDAKVFQHSQLSDFEVLSMVNDLVYTDVALHSCGYIEAADNVVRVAGDEAARGPFSQAVRSGSQGRSGLSHSFFQDVRSEKTHWF